MRKFRVAAGAILLSFALIGCSNFQCGGAITEYDNADIDISAMPENEAKYEQIADIITFPENYEGKIIKISGKAYKHHEDALNADYYFCLTTWAEGEEPEGICYVTSDGKYPEDGEMITVTGIMTNYEEDMDGTTVINSELREAVVDD